MRLKKSSLESFASAVMTLSNFGEAREASLFNHHIHGPWLTGP